MLGDELRTSPIYTKTKIETKIGPYRCVFEPKMKILHTETGEIVGLWGPIECYHEHFGKTVIKEKNGCYVLTEGEFRSGLCDVLIAPAYNGAMLFGYVALDEEKVLIVANKRVMKVMERMIEVIVDGRA